MTGVAPLSLVDHTSGFNVDRHISMSDRYVKMCGLVDEDLKVGLQAVCKFRNKVGVEKDEYIQFHLNQMKVSFNGYRASPTSDVATYNTDSCLQYLQVSFVCYSLFSISAPNNHFLVLIHVCANIA